MHSARTTALETLAARCEGLGVPQPALAQQLRFALWQCDHANNVTATAVRGAHQLKVRCGAGSCHVGDLQGCMIKHFGIPGSSRCLDMQRSPCHAPLIMACESIRGLSRGLN